MPQNPSKRRHPVAEIRDSVIRGTVVAALNDYMAKFGAPIEAERKGTHIEHHQLGRTYRIEITEVPG